MKNISFEDVYESFRLNTIRRYFAGTDASLLAVFAVFELTHNLRDLVNYVNGKRKSGEYALTWYKKYYDIRTNINPGVYKYIFGRKPVFGKTKKRIMKDAENEFNRILESAGVGKFITNLLEEEIS
jgi:hypothetical protein